MTFSRILSVLFLLLPVLFVFRLSYLGSQSRRFTPVLLGVQSGKLSPCPSKPNCVSSQADLNDSEHSIEPIFFQGSVADFKNLIIDKISGKISAAQGIGRSLLVTQNENYLHFEFKTALFGFVDDVEFYFPSQTPGRAEVRSASRVGYSDLKANRKRVEAIRSLVRDIY